MSRHQRSDESGQLTLLIIGYVVMALIVVSAVAAASSVYVAHKRLLSAADGAATAAAAGFNFHSQGTGAQLSLTPALVSGRTRKFLNDSGYAGQFDGFALAAASSSADGSSATVTLTAVAHPPILSLIVPGGFPISATSTSRPRATQ